ncbi:MAG: hypothetical protein CMI60_10145 [Parvibaculum sp.]|nr:hypothetical protein [Parvibaculum sp.]|tara:strand:- start:11747 stop:12133 length:387 start_codon:yes stop_codon:yes gene_type:complete
MRSATFPVFQPGTGGRFLFWGKVLKRANDHGAPSGLTDCHANSTRCRSNHPSNRKSFVPEVALTLSVDDKERQRAFQRQAIWDFEEMLVQIDNRRDVIWDYWGPPRNKRLCEIWRIGMPTSSATSSML